MPRALHYACIAACLVAVAIDAAMALALDGKSLLTTTISDLAAGDFAAPQDIGLVLVALSIAATGWTVWHRAGDDALLKVAAPALGLAGAFIVVLALYGEYGDGDTGGMVIHYRLVSLIGVLITLALLAIAWHARQTRASFAMATAAVAAIYFASGSAVMGIDTNWLGLIERLGAGALTVWLITFHTLLLRNTKIIGAAQA